MPRSRQHAAIALAEIANPRSVPMLLYAMLGEDDKVVRSDIGLALKACTNREAVEFLRQSLPAIERERSRVFIEGIIRDVERSSTNDKHTRP